MSNRNLLTVLGRSGNPVFRGNSFSPDAAFTDAASADRMTLAGTVNKTGLLLVLCLATATFVWNRFFQSGDPAAVMGLLWIGLIGGLVAALITMFKRQWAPVSRHRYSSYWAHFRYPGCIVARLQDWLDQAYGKLPTHDSSCYRRHRSSLSN